MRFFPFSLLLPREVKLLDGALAQSSKCFWTHSRLNLCHIGTRGGLLDLPRHGISLLQLHISSDRDGDECIMVAHQTVP